MGQWEHQWSISTGWCGADCHAREGMLDVGHTRLGLLLLQVGVSCLVCGQEQVLRVWMLEHDQDAETDDWELDLLVTDLVDRQGCPKCGAESEDVGG